MSWLTKLVGSLLRAMWPPLKQRSAERSAGRAPSEVSPSITDEVMDAALTRLGELKPEDRWWKQLTSKLDSVLVRPELFKRPSVREWLSKPQVRADIKRAAEIKLVGRTVPREVIVRLSGEYANLTGEDCRFAEQAICIAISFIQASVQGSVQDPGTASIVLTTGQVLGREIESVKSDVAKLAEEKALSDNRFISERYTQESRAELNRILRRRATPGQNTVEDLKKIIRDFEPGGRFAAAEQSVQDDVAYWLARVQAAAGDAAVAESEFRELEQRGYTVSSAAWALVDLARNDSQAALRRVRDLADAESQTTTFHILVKTEGRVAALKYVDGLDALTPNAFTAVGWYNVCAILIVEGRASDAATLLEQLPEDVLSECTILYYMRALSRLLPMFPSDRKSSLMSVGFLAVAERTLESPESLSARELALETAILAKQCASDAHDFLIEERCAIGILCLRLLDEHTRSQEVESILKAMKEGGEAAVRLIDVARAFSIDFDAEPLEHYLNRAQRIGGLDEQQLYAKLVLLDTPGRCADLIEFLDEEWGNLLARNDLTNLITMKIRALVYMQDLDGATAFFDMHASEVGDDVSARLRLMLSDARGEDPTETATELFAQSNAIEDLHNLVSLLKNRKQWKRLAPYTEQLFNREPSFRNAMLHLHCLRQTKISAKEISAFLDTTVGLIEQRPEIRSARAWAQFDAGNHLEAKRLNDELLSQRNNVDDLGLDINIAIRTGDWERFPSIGGLAWQRRAELDARMLLTLARLVGFSDPNQALTLAKEAVAKEDNDPATLLAANEIAIGAGRDDIAMSWVHKAAKLSKDGGPVSVFSYREIVDFMKSSAESWRQKNEMYRTAQLPLHMAASQFNRPFSQFLIAIPRQNAREADPRRRQPVPIRSGQHVPVAGREFARVALDITTLFILSELDVLEAVLDLLDEVFISPRFMDVLLEDRGKVAFHQPSRIAEAKPLNALVASGRLKVVAVKADGDLALEVGEEAAVLLKEAEERGGVFVHPGTLFKVGSYMDEEAALGERQSLIADPIDVLDALQAGGVITQAESDKALAVLGGIGGMTRRQKVPAATPVFLENLTVQYLQRAEILEPLLNSEHVVTIHKSTVDEWRALLDTEPMTETLVEALDVLRCTVRTGLMSGKVKFLPQSRKRDDGLNATTMLPIVDLLDDISGAEAVVVDDRMLGQNASFTDSKGKTVPLLSCLGLLEMLVRQGRLSEADRRESLHKLRARCFFCIPIEVDDLIFYLGQSTVEDGRLKETAELRTIRQYLAKLNATDVLCTSADLAYQDTLWRTATLVIMKLWVDTATPVAETSVWSDWVVDHILPDPELAMRFAPDGEARVEETVASQLCMSLMLPCNDAARRDAYGRWLQRSRLSMLVPANSHILDLAADQMAKALVRRTSEILNELASRDSANSAS